ncbi:helix-turn-helix transcriptional regulator [Cryobacterium psychrophilum]|uniref:WYL domain-containing protein n=1 Tax=Cryobacterium psychrophilum TaxID=41988 RepID=A0A4Y8KPH5_9MICO|nr:WYL domain-containing protein [Cryobacterium psychrophilum]TDW28511.1 proteasome accessory factor C [Cryobacterium psychrophilum]TFD80487.1 WYL domain-containing protein [Cryobacterium psychrophilum]
MSELHTPVAADKLTFLLSLVPYLIDHDDVSVAEVAERFGVPAARVRSAVRLIAVSGVPGETRQYLHGDLFDILWDEFEDNDRIVLTHRVAIDDSPRFSAREAAALIAGLQYLSALPENADRGAIASLMAKLTRGASAAPSQLVVANRESPEIIFLMQTAVRQHVQIEFDYLNSRGERVLRHVDPLRVESVDRDWYLRGWCHLRGAVRTFRLDRMRDVSVTNRPTIPHAGDMTLPDTLFEPSIDDVTVVLEMPEAVAALLADYRPERVERATKNDASIVRVTLRVAQYTSLTRLVTGLGGLVTVIGPPQARQAVSDWAAAGAAQYGER